MIWTKSKVSNKKSFWQHKPSLYSLFFILMLSLISTPFFCDQIFINENNDIIRIEVVKSVEHILILMDSINF